MNSAADAALEEILDALHFGVYQLWSQKDIADTKRVFIPNLHSGSWVVEVFFWQLPNLQHAKKHRQVNPFIFFRPWFSACSIHVLVHLWQAVAEDILMSFKMSVINPLLWHGQKGSNRKAS